MNTLRLLAPYWLKGLPRIDRTWLAVVLVFAGLALLAPAQARNSLSFTVAALLGILPYLALSVGLAAYVKASGSEALIVRAFQGHIVTMVMLAAGAGALSPFCSCGVIPLIAALLAIGVPLPAVMAFWLASPLMDPSMFLLTFSTLGMQFAIAKTLAAFGIGLIGGFGIFALQRHGFLLTPLRDGIGDGGCGGAKIRRPGQILWPFWRTPERRALFITGARDNLLFLGKWLTLAFALESLMLAYIPADAVVGLVGDDGWLSIAIATVVGVPAYLNGYAALPLVAGLIDQGMAPGAGMAFLIGGGVTSIPAAIAVWALARPPVFLAYLAFAFIGAVSAGIGYGAVSAGISFGLL